MFEFMGKKEEYLTLVDQKIKCEVGGFMFSYKQFEVNPQVFIDLAYNLERKVIAGRAFVNSEQEVGPQMQQVKVTLTKLLNREIERFTYSPATTWEGSPDHERYIQKTGNRISLSGVV